MLLLYIGKMGRLIRTGECVGVDCVFAVVGCWLLSVFFLCVVDGAYRFCMLFSETPNMSEVSGGGTNALANATVIH